MTSGDSPSASLSTPAQCLHIAGNGYMAQYALGKQLRQGLQEEIARVFLGDDTRQTYCPAI